MYGGLNVCNYCSLMFKIIRWGALRIITWITLNTTTLLLLHLHLVKQWHLFSGSSVTQNFRLESIFIWSLSPFNRVLFTIKLHSPIFFCLIMHSIPNWSLLFDLRLWLLLLLNLFLWFCWINFGFECKFWILALFQCLLINVIYFALGIFLSFFKNAINTLGAMILDHFSWFFINDRFEWMFFFK